MMIARFVRGLAGALALLAGFSSMPAPAQVAPVPVVHVPCCRCVDGSILRVNLNTRTAPWRVRAPGSPIFVPVVPATNVAWTNGAAPAGWVSHPNGGQVGIYTYELRIQVPRCMIRGQLSLAGVFSADNGVTLSLVRPVGLPITLGVRPPPIAFQGVSNFPVPPLAANAMATPGTYILRATVLNLGGPSGFVLRGQLAVRCPRDPALGHLSAAEQAEAEAVPTEE